MIHIVSMNGGFTNVILIMYVDNYLVDVSTTINEICHIKDVIMNQPIFLPCTSIIASPDQV